MRRDRVVATYGRHRQRVITVDAVGPWLGARDNIFSSSSDSFRSQSSHNESSTDRKRVFDSFSSSKENESEVSWIQEKQGGRYARKRQFGKAAMSKKQHTIRNNVFDSSVDTSDLNINAAKMRTSQQQKDVLKDKTNGLYTSPLNTKETKDKPIPTGRKKQVKLKRVADTTKKSIQAARPSNNSVDPSSCEMSSRFNFAELENYSLVISDSPLIETGAVGYSPEIEVRGSRKTSITAATTALTSTPQANNLVSKNLHKNLLKSGLMQTHNSAHMTTPNERSVKSKGDLTNSILGQQTVRPPRLGQSSTPLGAVPVSNLQQSSTPRHSSAFALISMETGKERIAVQSGKQFEENTPGKHSQYDRLHLSTFSSIASSPCLADMSALSHKSNVSELCSPSFHSAQSELSCRVELTHHSLDSLRKIANNSRIGVPRAGVGSRREEEGKEHEEEDEESEEEEEDKEEEEEEKGEQGECVEGVEDLSDIEEGSESVSDIRYELTHMSLADDTAADQSHCSTNQATENGQPTLQNEPQKGRTNTGSSVNSFRRDPVLRDLNEPVLPTFQGRFLRSHKKLMMSDGFEMRQRVSKQQTNMSYNDYSVLVDETNSPVQDRQQITYNVSSQECIELSSDIIEVSDGESDSDGESGSGANNTNSEHLFAAAKYELAEVAEEEQNRTSENESREETEQTETEIRNIQCEMENDDDISYQLVKGPPETQTVHSTDQDSNQEVSDETTRLEDKENTLESGEEDTEQENIDCDEREAESDLSDQSESEIIDYDESEAEKDASNQSDSEYEPEADDTNNCVSSGEESECASNDEGSSDENGEASEEEDTAEQPVAKTPAQTSRRSTVLDRLCYSLKALTPIRAKKGGPVISPRTKVLLSCDQQHPVPFSKCFTAMMLRKCVKIGEGVYGEVFKTQRAKNNVAMKIIPIEGDFEVNDEPQKSYAEMLPEIVISKELSDLRTNQDNMTSAFVNVHGVSVVRGRYPGALLRQWDDFHDTKGSENDRPDMFGSDQLYVVFEFEECGCDLEGFEFSSPAQARSVLHQVALALAVAENALQFEHRDLHWGNVLVKSTREQHVTHVLDGKHMQVPTAGVKAAVIDFTLSRLRKDDCAVFCDLSRDPTLFIGQGDYQFEVYRLMQQENGNDWSAYRPFTNVLWMRYLADKLLNSKPYPQSSCKQYQLQLRELSKFVQDVLQYSSATHLVCECPYLQYT